MKRQKTIAARLFLAAGAICLGAVIAFAAQAGVGLNNQLPAHQHRGSSDGGVLQGFSPVGTFYINTNNSGNITVSPTMSSGLFMWRPGTQNFTAGLFDTVNGGYTMNMGTATWNMGYNNLAKAHYSGIMGSYNSIPNWRYNAFLLGNHLINTANNALMLGDGANVYPNSVNNSTGTVKIYSGAWAPSITVAQASAWASPGSVGIKTETPNAAYALDVNGVIHGDGSALTGVVGAAGLLYVDTDGNLTPVITAVTDTFLEVVDSGDITPKV